MCGTPNASRAMLAFAETGAAISPEVSGSGRHANQYTAPRRATSKTAMLRLIARSSGEEDNTARLYRTRNVSPADPSGCHRRAERLFRRRRGVVAVRSPFAIERTGGAW